MPSRPRNPCLSCGVAIYGYGHCSPCSRKLSAVSSAVVTVVTGPPCSGKTTWVRDRVRPGDLVVDYDLLAQALGSPASHAHPPALHPFTLAARTAVIDRLRQPHDVGRVWIIATNDPQKVWPGAEIVTMDTPAEECHRRATAAGRPEGWHRLIDAWSGW